MTDEHTSVPLLVHLLETPRTVIKVGAFCPAIILQSRCAYWQQRGAWEQISWLLEPPWAKQNPPEWMHRGCCGQVTGVTYRGGRAQKDPTWHAMAKMNSHFLTETENLEFCLRINHSKMIPAESLEVFSRTETSARRLRGGTAVLRGSWIQPLLRMFLNI